jgi:hypothetical protein
MDKERAVNLLGKNLLWAAFAIFVCCALYFGWHADIFNVSKPSDAGKVVIWAAFVIFTVYSIYCSTKENLFKTIGVMSRLHWGRQIGLDLYIGLTITACVIYLHTGSAMVALIWLVPLYMFGNLATLLYFAINYDSLMTKFLT